MSSLSAYHGLLVVDCASDGAISDILLLICDSRLWGSNGRDLVR